MRRAQTFADQFVMRVLYGQHVSSIFLAYGHEFMGLARPFTR